MKTRLLLIALMFTLFNCSNDIFEPLPVQDINFEFDFSSSEDWIIEYADYPNWENEIYQLGHSYDPLPDSLDDGTSSLMITGNNHSGDLFMYAMKRVSGLSPEATYEISFELDFASNAPLDCEGVGGSPGSSVFIKAGATTSRPTIISDETEWYRFKYDKGNQATEGADAINLGLYGNTNTCPDSSFVMINQKTTTQTLKVTTDRSGKFWIFIGTDSGFEAKTTIYYSNLKIALTNGEIIFDH